MTDYSVYWSGARAKALKMLPEGVSFTVLFGGDHISQPSFLRAGVTSGDRLHIITVSRGEVQLLGAATVDTLAPTTDIHPAEFHAHADMTATEAWVTRSGWPRAAFFAALCVTCTSEVATLTDSLGPFAPRAVPPDDVKAFTFLNKRGSRSPKGVETGRATVPLAFQGIYRLAPPTAAALDRLARA